MSINLAGSHGPHEAKDQGWSVRCYVQGTCSGPEGLGSQGGGLHFVDSDEGFFVISTSPIISRSTGSVPEESGKGRANSPFHTRDAMVMFPNPPGIRTCEGGIVEEPGMLQELGRGVRGREDAYLQLRRAKLWSIKRWIFSQPNT